MNFNRSLHPVTRNIRFVVQDIAVASRLIRGKSLTPYIGLVGYANLGDEVLYQAHRILFPSYKFVPYRKDTMSLEKIIRLRYPPYYHKAILGGGTLINRGEDWINKVEHLLAQGSKMSCLGTGVANPIFWGGKRRGRASSRWIKALKQFEFIGVRGPHSREILLRSGLKDVQITGDTALTLAKEKVKVNKSQGRVGLCYGDVEGNPMWGDSLQYRDELIKAIKAIIASGSKVVLLPVWKEDIPSNKLLIQMVNHPDLSMAEVFDSYANYADKLRKCDLFIGQKLHSTVMALMNRVPSIMVEYRPKCSDFMASIDLGKYVIKTSDFQLKTFMQMYTQLQKDYIAVRSKAEARILEYKNLQMEQAKKIQSIFRS